MCHPSGNNCRNICIYLSTSRVARPSPPPFFQWLITSLHNTLGPGQKCRNKLMICIFMSARLVGCMVGVGWLLIAAMLICQQMTLQVFFDGLAVIMANAFRPMWQIVNVFLHLIRYCMLCAYCIFDPTFKDKFLHDGIASSFSMFMWNEMRQEFLS